MNLLANIRSVSKIHLVHGNVKYTFIHLIQLIIFILINMYVIYNSNNVLMIFRNIFKKIIMMNTAKMINVFFISQPFQIN